MASRSMRVGLPTALLGLVLSAGAAGQTAGQTAQQELMRACNADAGARNLTGEARQTFMSQCLAGRATPSAGAAMTPGSPTPAQAAQQERMRACNADAGARNLTGETRQRFMSDCLAGRVTPGAAGAAGGPSSAQAAQQDRMRTCNAEAGTRNLAGEARQRFMSDCLAGRAGAGAPAGAGAQGSGGGTPRRN
jgi:hypothetical protein